MTIHKAKGLEFDYVILPSLERIPKREDDRFLGCCLPYYVSKRKLSHFYNF